MSQLYYPHPGAHVLVPVASGHYIIGGRGLRETGSVIPLFAM